METTTRMGMNRTGVQMSPQDIDRMLESVDAIDANAGDGAAMAAVRTSYITEADVVGTVPMPGTVRGALQTGVKKLTGKNPEVFIDKLGERLAFERSGTRLYDALLTKYRATPEKLAGMSDEQLTEIRDEEAKHFMLLAGAMESLGADPTAQTPCADITGVESMGLMQVLDDPRTTVAQCLHAILVAELADNAGWELLIRLAQDMGQDGMVEEFRAALAQEQEHLRLVSRWHNESVRADL